MNRKQRRTQEKADLVRRQPPPVPFSLAAIFNEAVRHHWAGRLREAEYFCRRVVVADPRYADGWHILGIIAGQVALAERARALIIRAISIEPRSAIYHFSLGNVFKARHDLDMAAHAFEQSLRRQPDHLGARINLGNTLRALGRTAEAFEAYSVAIALRPDAAHAYSFRGAVLNDLNRYEQAAVDCRTAVKLIPGDANLRSNLARTMIDLKQLERASAILASASCLSPSEARIYDNWGLVYGGQRRGAEAIASFRRAVALAPENPESQSNLLMSLYYQPEFGGAAILEQALRYGALFEPVPMRAHANSADPDRRLRIGYVSGELMRHPVGYFLARVIENHDPAAVEVYCYSNRSRGDALTDRLRTAAHHWRSVVGLADQQAAQLIAADSIDILIDLAGHTGLTRLPLFAGKPAPVQASWLGYWGTTGLRAMDYVLSDAVTVAPDEERWFSERVLRLPDSRFCYAPPDDAPPVVAPPAAKNGYITFGSFNNLSKVTGDVVGLWAAVLKTTPDARLLLKWTTLADPDVRRTIQDEFGAAGIPPDRLILRGASRHALMLAEYGDVDIALDPFPFSGGLTSCEALWMGVPLVTLPGALPQTRQTLGFLRLLGLDDLAAATPDDYVRLAAGLAADPSRLANLRATLRERMAASPLCDGPAFTRNLEVAYRTMWRRWCTASTIV